jgi:putative membrane protein
VVTVMMYGWDGWSWGGWVLMVLAMAVFWALVITGVVIAVRYVAGGNANSKHYPASAFPRAEDVLAERVARGEIDEDEFRCRVAAIREHRAS